MRKQASQRATQQIGFVVLAMLLALSSIIGLRSAFAAPLPAVIDAPANVTDLLGETQSFTFNFTNPDPTNTGFSPFFDMAVDTSGPDGATSAPLDGFSAPTINAGGLQLTPIATIPVTGATYTNPFTGDVRSVPAGFGTNDTIYIYQLPFGSFTPGQVTLVRVDMPTSNLADIPGTLAIAITPGFRDTDAVAPFSPQYGATTNITFTPQLWTLEKIYLGPEDETATGPNYKRRYRIDVDIATGQLVQNVQVTDLLPNTMQWTGAAQTTQILQGATIANNLTGTTATASLPGGTIIANFGNVTGIDGVDATLEFEFYVPRDTDLGYEILPQPNPPTPNPAGGTDRFSGQDANRSSENNASVSGTWDPIDTRDATVSVQIDQAGPEHTLEEHSIATQKTFEAVDATNAPVAIVTPGSTLIRYTIDFQVSDYYAMNGIFVEDELGDGQRLYIAPGFEPTLRVENPYTYASGGSRAATSNGAFSGAGTIDYQRRYTVRGDVDSDPSAGVEGYAAAGPSGGVYNLLAPGAIDGDTFLRFNISNELIARGLPGILVGGEIANGGGDPTNNTPNATYGPAQGTITYWVLVKQEFSDNFPSGDRSIDQGDRLFNDVPLIQGNHLSTLDLSDGTPTDLGTDGTDDSAATPEIPTGIEDKTVYAINGRVIPSQTPADTVFSIQAGDRVTYRLMYDVPISSFENLQLIDFPPLPVMAVGPHTNYTFVRGAPTYAAYEIALAPDDTFFSTFPAFPNLTPAAALAPQSITTNQIDNTIIFNFDDWEDFPQRRSTRIALLITLPVSDDPFVDDLFMTNQLRITESSTNQGSQTLEELRRFQLVRPDLYISKGVVGFKDTGLALGGITFANPTVTANFSGGPIYNSTQASAIGARNATVTDVLDAGDVVRYAIVAQNPTRGDAFDIRIADQVQPGFVIPATFAGLNLQVRRGDGTLLTLGSDYTLVSYNNTTGAFEIELTDNYTSGNVNPPPEIAPDDRSGALSRGEAAASINANDNPPVTQITNGSNTVVVQYDLTLAGTIDANQDITNTAAITKYAAREGGRDLTDPNEIPGASDPQDTAITSVRIPLVSKTLVGTELNLPGNNAATQVAIGELATYTLQVTIPEGEMPSTTIVDTLDAGLAFVDLTAVSVSPILSFSAGGLPTIGTAPANTTITDGGRTITFNLGNVVNTNNDNTVAETITLTYRVVALNTAPNQAGSTRNNSVVVNWLNDGSPDSLPAIRAGQQILTDGTVSGTATPLTIIEPTLTTTKQVTNLTDVQGPAASVRADNNDQIEYTITINNAASGSANAHEVSLYDTIPASLTSLTIQSATSTGNVQINGVVGTLTTADLQLSGAVLTFNPASNIDMEPGSTITIVVRGLFTGAAGQVIQNTDLVRWSSMEGTVTARSSYAATSVERTGADGPTDADPRGTAVGSLNDYWTRATADIISPPLVRKTIIDSSETTTSPSTAHPVTGGTSDRLTIGEVVRYRLYASIPEGTSVNTQIQDQLPPGLRFLNDGTARYTFISNDTITSATNGSITGLASTNIAGSTTELTSLNTTNVVGTFADDNIATSATGAGTGDATIYASGQDVFFRLGNLSNIDNDVDAEYVVIEFNALVENIVANQAGTTLNNTFGFLIDTDTNGSTGYVSVIQDANGNGLSDVSDTISNANDPNNDATGTAGASNTAAITLLEPALTLNKQVISTTGTVVTYRLSLTNTGGTASQAENVVISDVLNSTNFTLNSPASLTATLAGGATGATNNSSGNTVSFTIATIPVGASVTIDYTVNVLVTPTGTTTLDNTATATFTDLTGDNGSMPFFGTLAATLGTPGSATGERTGADGFGGALNDYAVQDIEQLGSLGDRVYYDADADGIQDVGEPGIVGVTITIRWEGPDGIFGNADDSVITTVTGTDGLWVVNALPVGVGVDYRASAPATVGGMNMTDAIDNGGAANANPNSLGTGVTSITLTGTNAGNTNNRTRDFGYRGTASLGNRIYIDADGDGVQDSNGLEPSLPGVATTLLWAGLDNIFGNADDLTFTQNATNAATNYLYSNLPAGDFRVTVSATGGSGGVPDNTSLTDALDNAILNTNPDSLGAGVVQTNLTTGENEITIDYGYRGTASIGDTVWYDVNGNGVLDGNEFGLAGVSVTLLWSGPDGDLSTAGDNVTFTTTTDANGTYLFPSLPVNGASDPYRVTVTPLAAYPTQTYDADGTGTANTSTYNLGATEDNRTQDFGYRGTAQLGNFVWEDLNGNGRQDAEPGIDGVAVSLFFDRNNDGDFADAGENSALATTTTAGGGFYSFTNLAAGNYQVVFGNSDGVTTYAYTVRDSAVASDTTDSDADSSTGRTITYTLANGDNNQTIDAGLVELISLGNRVFYDLDADGIQDVGELGITNANVTVTWLGPDAAVGGGDDVAYPAVTTGANGLWSVTNLPPGSFQVAVTNLPGGVTLTDSIDNATLNATEPVIVSTTSGVNRDDIDFGYVGSGSIGDRVFLDINNNGSYDAGEGIDGVTVTLTGDLNGDGSNDTLTTTTSADGFYQFTNLRTTGAGVAYTVTVNTAQIPQDGLGNPLPNTVDPDTAGIGDSTSAVNLTTASPSNMLQDFGYRGTGRIGDTIFLDANSNNAPDAGEGITGVNVTLTADVDGDGNSESYTTSTNASGIYDFSYLPVRTPTGTLINYTVTVDTSDLPSAVTNTVDPDTANPGDNTSALTLPTSGAPENLDQDFGYRGVGAIGDRVFLDINNNGSYDAGEGLAGIGMTLTADLNGDGVSETLSTTTDNDGFYQFSNLPIFQSDGSTAVSYQVDVVTATLPAGVSNTVDPDGGNDSRSNLTLSLATPSNQAQDFGYRGTASLGDRVWIDANGDTNQGDPAIEPGIPVVDVQLTWAGPDGIFGNGDDVTSADITDASGLYDFTGLPAGSFRVTVDSTDLASNLSQTYDLSGALDHQADRSLVLGEAATNVDFGYRGNASVGDRVWLDQDNDGIQDPAEVGLSGAVVTVTWYGMDATLGTADDIIFTTVTGVNGAYLVDGIPANVLVGGNPNYRVEVSGVQVASLTLTDSIDNSVIGLNNPVDIQVSPINGNPLNDRRDVDFGYDGASTLAGTVFRDDNNNGIQEVGEPGIAGVSVTLTGVDIFGNAYIDPGTGLPYVVVTDSNGDYLFQTVVPGTYTLTEAQPGNYNDGIDTAGSLGGNAGNDLISGIPVGINQNGVEYNFGEIGTFVEGIVFRDDNRDGNLAAAETTRLGGVTIDLYDSTGTTLIATTTTQPDGTYRFENIAAGNYRIIETQPTGYGSSPSGPFAPNTRDVAVPLAGLSNQNFGEILASISGVVYIDANVNGSRDAVDTGRLGNIPITLSGNDANGNPVNITVYTNASGAYRFDNLIASDEAGYTISEGSAAPYTDRAANPGTGVGGSLGTASDANTISGVVLMTGSQGINYDFGEILPAQPFISGSVYHDRDRDGIRDGSEDPIQSVTITLYDAGPDGLFGTSDDGTVRTTTTDSTGNYLFTGLVTGRNYQIIETQPVIYGNSPVGPSISINVNNLPSTGSTNNNFGEILSSLAGTVYLDRNGDGSLQSGEPGIGGVTVQLTGTDLSGSVYEMTITTNPDGTYLFSDVPAGNYGVIETQPAGYADGAETIGSEGGINTINDIIGDIPLGAGIDATTYNFGELGVPVSGLVFYDANRNGSLDPSETTRLSGVTITLIDSNGVVFGTTTTGLDGSYLFSNVPPGNYTIVETQPNGYGDPLGGPFAPNSRTITVSNTAITNQNFGETLSTLAGSVYVDSNDDGIRQGGESGIGGVTVRLDWAGPDNTFGTADDQVGYDSTITGSNGGYLFDELPTGVYRVVEPSQPAPYSDGRETAGSASGTTSTNEQISDIPVAAGVDLINYNFGELLPVGSFISGSVYLDTNNNGSRDPGEPGIPGVTITLGGAGSGTTTTDANGNYLFTGLTTGGNYTVDESQPNLYTNGLENSSNTITINNLPAAGSSNNNFGELPGSLSGSVYYDRNSNGSRDPGEPGIPNTTITLTGTDLNGGSISRTTTTDSNGDYLFENLPAGSYIISEIQPSGYNDGSETAGSLGGNTSTNDVIATIALGAGDNGTTYNFAEVGTSLSGTVWVDTNRNGSIDASETARLQDVTITLIDNLGNVVAATTTLVDGSYSFTNLLPGNYTIIETQPNLYGSTTSNSLAVNLPLSGLSNQNFGEVLGSIAGTVYADLNGNGIQDAGEPGIASVAVALNGTDVNGTPVSATLVTDSNGDYLFSDLPAGTYQVVETQPTGFNDGQEQAGSTGGDISTNDQINNIPLGAGVNSVNNDFGELSALISGKVWLDRDRDGSIDSSESGITSITIELRDSGGNLIATTTTNADGSYSFVGIPGGDYTVVELQPNGYGSSTPNSVSITVPNNGSVTNVNFGETLSSISGTVFIDSNNNGSLDSGEIGIPSTIVTLTGTDANGNPVTITVMTDANGDYSFTDLLSGTYTIIETQPGNHGDAGDELGNGGGTLTNDQVSNINLSTGQDASGYNFGETPLIPTAIELISFSATPSDAGVVVRWATALEVETWGFQLYRSSTGNRADAVLVTPELILASGGSQGASYQWVDTTAEAGVIYTYWLAETELDGDINEHGPARTQPVASNTTYMVYLPEVTR